MISTISCQGRVYHTRNDMGLEGVLVRVVINDSGLGKASVLAEGFAGSDGTFSLVIQKPQLAGSATRSRPAIFAQASIDGRVIGTSNGEWLSAVRAPNIRLDVPVFRMETNSGCDSPKQSVQRAVAPISSVPEATVAQRLSHNVERHGGPPLVASDALAWSSTGSPRFLTKDATSMSHELALTSAPSMARPVGVQRPNGRGINAIQSTARNVSPEPVNLRGSSSAQLRTASRIKSTSRPPASDVTADSEVGLDTTYRRPERRHTTASLPAGWDSSLESIWKVRDLLLSRLDPARGIRLINTTGICVALPPEPQLPGEATFRVGRRRATV